MSNSRNREFVDDHVDQNGDESFDSSDASSSMNGVVETSSVGSGTTSRQIGEIRNEIGLTERLTNIFVEENDGDLLLQQSDREDRVLQWLQALDMQVIGACRTDERLKPLLKVNVSNGLAEDRLLAHLSQHFEPSEVGMLARCFCIPLVSIRVGKINKQGTHFCPTAIRGNLSLTLLPTSDLRLLFVGDNGQTEQLFTLSCKLQCPGVSINEIPADNSGRSFLVKIPDGKGFYYWCSEKSKLLGVELLSKMKDLIKRKPSIAELTGISESRLGCFAVQLRAYLLGSAVSNTQASCSGSRSPNTLLDTIDVHNGQSSSTTSKSLRSRHSSSQVLKVNSLHQGSLSPRSSSFKEGLARNLSSLRSTARDKIRRRGDNHLSVSESLTTASPITHDSLSCNQAENDKLPDVKSCPFTPNLLESLGKLAVPPTLSSVSQVSSLGPPLFSPHYCWCPPGSSTLQHSAAAEFPTSSIESLKLPPLSSILPANGASSLLKPTPPLDLADVPSLDFPAFLPEPLVRLPMASSQQIPTFTPLICDPIVHIPVIDVCSSGQGYLVSAGPTISTTISPLHPKLVNPLLPDTDSMVEKGARETLRLLISGSTQNNPPLIDVFPAVLTNADENKGILVAGSRGLYSGTRDISAITDGIAAMTFVTLSASSMGDCFVKHCSSGCDNPDSKQVGSSGSDESCSDRDGAKLTDTREEGTSD
ncbi:hypothetical protein QQP08_005566 [Theobroma cacao]|nr:hypothetical protein QQP08_005566 [Theobroma cacao]